MKKVLLLLVVLLAAGGGGAWYFFMGTEPNGAEAGDAAEAHAEPRPEPIFVSVGEVIVPIYDRNGEASFVVTKIELDITDSMSPDEVRLYLPRLRDAYVTTLSTMAGRGEIGDDAQRNARIKRALQMASDRILGRNVVREVLLQRAWQQPM